MRTFGSITTKNIAGQTGLPTAGSYISIGIVSGSSIATVQLSGTWTGTVQVEIVTNGVTRAVVDASYITSLTTGGTGAIPSGSTDTFQINTYGGGMLFITNTGTITGTIKATLDDD